MVSRDRILYVAPPGCTWTQQSVDNHRGLGYCLPLELERILKVFEHTYCGFPPAVRHVQVPPAAAF